MRFKKHLTRIARWASVAGVATATIAALPATQTSAAVTLAAPWQYGITLAAGGQHLCFVGNTSYNCAGENSDGQVGDGTTTDTNYGKKIEDSSNTMKFANIAYATAGLNHSCLITSSGATPASVVYCWGDNQYGQLGDGTTTDRLVPTPVADNPASGFVNSGISRVVAGYNHTCVLKASQIYCWGRNDQGQVGDGSTTDRSLAVKPGGTFASGNATEGMALGESHTCVTSDTSPRKAYCWGDNFYGQLGDGTNNDSLTPVATNISSAAGAIDAYFAWTFAATADSNCLVGNYGNIYCWGRNDQGQLGDGTTTNQNVPTRMPDMGTFTNQYTSGANNGASRYIGAGGKTVCARTVAGATPNRYLHCWGGNAGGQVAGSTNSFENTPVDVPANSAESFDPTADQSFNNVAVSKSTTHGFACFAKWCWGGNASGQLGRGDTADATLPVKFKIGTEQQSGGGGGSGGSGGGSGGPQPTIVSGVVATAVLDGNKVDVSFSNLPASGLMSVAITIAPKSFDLSVPPMGSSYTTYTTRNLSGATLPTVTNNSFTVSLSSMSKMTFTNGIPGTPVAETFTADGSYQVAYSVVGAATGAYPTGWRAANNQPPTFETLTVTAAAASSTVAPTTTATPTTTTVKTTTTVANVYAAAKPGVTVTDTKVYSAPPVQVAASSSITMLTAAQNKVMDIVTQTPSVCLPNDDELVFINDGKCIAQVVNAKTRAVLKVLKTTVVEDDIADVKVGNAVVTLAPIYFDVMSSTLDATALARIKAIKAKVSAAGSVLVIGHSGTLNGNSPANVAIAKARALATVAALKSAGASGPFAISSVGALAPASTGKTETDQAKNRRAVIVLIP